MNAITKGTPEQIKWAAALVEKEIARLDKMLAPIPPKEQRSEVSQKLYGEQIAFVKTVRNTLANKLQSAKWVIDNRSNLFYYTAELLRKQDAQFAARFNQDWTYSIISAVNDGNWLKGAGF